MLIEIKKTLKKIKFYTVNLPLIFFMIPVGFIFEFIVTFPFIIFCTLDSMGNRKKTNKNTNP